MCYLLEIPLSDPHAFNNTGRVVEIDFMKGAHT